jgi:hypothetical protein
MSARSIIADSQRRTMQVIALAAFMLFGILAMNRLPATFALAAPPPYSGIAIPDGLAGGEWSGGPRECDVLNGLSSACLFMD